MGWSCSPPAGGPQSTRRLSTTAHQPSGATNASSVAHSVCVATNSWPAPATRARPSRAPVVEAMVFPVESRPVRRRHAHAFAVGIVVELRHAAVQALHPAQAPRVIVPEAESPSGLVLRRGHDARRECGARGRGRLAENDGNGNRHGGAAEPCNAPASDPARRAAEHARPRQRWRPLDQRPDPALATDAKPKHELTVQPWVAAEPFDVACDDLSQASLHDVSRDACLRSAVRRRSPDADPRRPSDALAEAAGPDRLAHELVVLAGSGLPGRRRWGAVHERGRRRAGMLGGADLGGRCRVVLPVAGVRRTARGNQPGVEREQSRQRV